MIDLHGQAGLPYINRGVYTGSYEGMRYRLRKKEEEDKKTLEAALKRQRRIRRRPGSFPSQTRALHRPSPG